MMLMDISFSCECGELIGQIVYVPKSNFTTETNKVIGSYYYDEIDCELCQKPYDICVVKTLYKTDCYVNNGETEVSFGMPYFSESDYDDDDEIIWIMQSETQIEIFQNHIKSVEKILEADIDAEAYFSLLVMLYGHVVAAVEAYLSSTFIQKVTNSEKLTRKLIETDPIFSKMTFTLKEIFEQKDKLKLTVASHLNDLIFHNLNKVKPMYKDVLDCEFGDISWLFKAVIIRHNCVHRAGYDKENTKIELSVETLSELVTKAQDLTSLIESKLHPTSLSEFDLSF